MNIIQKINNRIKYETYFLINDVKWYFNLNQINPHDLNGTVILIYHGIDQRDSREYNTRFISQKILYNQLYLFKEYFNIVSLQDILNGDIEPNQFNLAITFDDGYWNNYSYALPVLEKLRIPATFCITGIRQTDLPIIWVDYLDIVAKEFQIDLHINNENYFIQKRLTDKYFSYLDKNGQNLRKKILTNPYLVEELFVELEQKVGLKQIKPFATYWQQMTIHEIQQLDTSPLVNVASHGLNHYSLPYLDEKDIKYEMRQSKLFLENILQRKVDTFAYPNGAYSSKTVEIGLDLGYTNHLVMNYNNDKDRTNSIIFDRQTIDPFISKKNQLLSIIKSNDNA